MMRRWVPFVFIARFVFKVSDELVRIIFYRTDLKIPVELVTGGLAADNG